jgi:ribosomal protein S18 acetylase RimI-like enzyme
MINRRLTEADIPEITEVHLKAFKNFFLSELGDKFLNLYYKSFLKDSSGFGVGVFDSDKKLLGFSVVTTCSKGFNKNLLIKNIAPFFRTGIGLLLTKPGALLRLARNMTKKSNHDFDNGDYAELFSIAVDPDEQGKGIGKILLENTEKLVSAQGCKRITLTTDFFDNDNTISFYKKMGYSIFYDFMVYPERRMYKMIKNLIE